MDKNKVRQLLKADEGPKLDFKLELSLETEGEKKELTKDVIAIANSRGGRGYIIFGVEDKTKIIRGIDPAYYQEEQIQQIIYNRCDPPVPIAVDFVEEDGLILAVLTIFRSSHKPHMMLNNGAFYIRRGSTTDVSRRGEIANMFQENGLMTYETVVLKNSTMKEFEIQRILTYFKKLGVLNEQPNNIILEAMGFISKNSDNGEYYPTIGGMLMFGKDPSIHLPQVFIKLINGKDATYVRGNVFEMMEQTKVWIDEHLKGNYPLGAVEEVLANAILHRDYMDITRGIVVNAGEKSVEISNPGALPVGGTISRFMSESNPERRNPWLYQRLAAAADGSWTYLNNHSGLIKIKEAFADIGEVKFLNIASHNLFKVILPRTK